MVGFGMVPGVSVEGLPRTDTAAVLDMRVAQLGARWLRRHILADVGLVQDVSFQLVTPRVNRVQPASSW